MRNCRSRNVPQVLHIEYKVSSGPSVIAVDGIKRKMNYYLRTFNSKERDLKFTKRKYITYIYIPQLPSPRIIN